MHTAALVGRWIGFLLSVFGLWLSAFDLWPGEDRYCSAAGRIIQTWRRVLNKVGVLWLWLLRRKPSNHAISATAVATSVAFGRPHIWVDDRPVNERKLREVVEALREDLLESITQEDEKVRHELEALASALSGRLDSSTFGFRLWGNGPKSRPTGVWVALVGMTISQLFSIV